MDSPITRAEHTEFEKRMQEEHSRQNHRINELEKAFEQNNKLLISVEKLALSIENMQRELRDLCSRINVIEDRDGEMWRKVVAYALTAVVGAVIGFISTQVGM